ncbi:MAG: hypothetical protein QGH20_03980, partial [Candidatus Latescibacteria bacterium]|nr:hypothetical protein [Candidatus Latescibacterota bacterium]
MNPIQIDTIFFLIHPLCYESHAEDPEFSSKYRHYIDYEKKIKERWLARIEEMASNEALVVGSPGCSMELEEFVVQRLGHRGLVIRDVITHQPELWDTLLSDETKTALGKDLLSMYWKHEFQWKSDPLGQPIIARGWAERIKMEFGERGLVYDPDTVRTEGWGESFEGCVANYTRFLGTYLGLANPIEDEFEMTVPGAKILLTARFVERISIDSTVRLYLWEVRDGRFVGWFHKAMAAIGDPSVVARFATAG